MGGGGEEVGWGEEGEEREGDRMRKEEGELEDKTLFRTSRTLACRLR